MGKRASNDVLDGSLGVIKAANMIVALPFEPSSFEHAFNNKLASANLKGSDFTISDGDINGRKITVGAKTGLSVIENGIANHVALLEIYGKKLLYVTTCPAQSLVEGGVVSIAPWSIEIAAPV